MIAHIMALTMGDPGGIGPELAIKAANDRSFTARTNILIVGSQAVLKKHAEIIGLPFDVPVVNSDDFEWTGLGDVALEEVGWQGEVDDIPLGRPSAVGGKLSIECVEHALRLVQQGFAGALITGPINKEAVGLAGYPWAGHTDFLKERTNTDHVVMMLVGGDLRVGLVTHHVPLADVPGLLTSEKILAALRVMDADLQRLFGLTNPRIAVAALNPHASDGGRFGDEEERIITPAIELAKKEGINCSEALPADMMFTPWVRPSYDAALAMYHDQGLTPLKMLADCRGVNITLGLPIVRTSVGHGTAYDIVGRCKADTGSLEEAIRLAVDIVERLER